MNDQVPAPVKDTPLEPRSGRLQRAIAAPPKRRFWSRRRLWWIGGSVVVLMVGLLPQRFARDVLVPLLTAVALLTAIGLSIWQWGEHKNLVAGALRRWLPNLQPMVVQRNGSAVRIRACSRCIRTAEKV